MTIEIKEVTKQGDKRWLRPTCPQCGGKVIVFIKTGGKREQKIQCGNCNVEFIITWEESDETLH